MRRLWRAWRLASGITMAVFAACPGAAMAQEQMTLEIATGPNTQMRFPASSIEGAELPAALRDGVLNGPTAYGGTGCDSSGRIPSRHSVDLALRPLEEAIMVLQRGDCTSGEKARNAWDAGWGEVLIANDHSQSGGAESDPVCDPGGFQGEPVVAVCTSHPPVHLVFNTDHAEEPLPGTLGERVVVHAPSAVPTCSDSSVTVPYRGSVTVPLPCRNGAGVPMTRSLVALPSAGFLSNLDQAAGAVTYTNTGGEPGAVDSFQFQSSTRYGSSAPATARITVGPRVDTPSAGPPPENNAPSPRGRSGARRARAIAACKRRFRGGSRAVKRNRAACIRRAKRRYRA